MAFSISPSVFWTETDLSMYASSIVDTIGAIAGTFKWGPVEDPFLITEGQEELIRVYAKPDNDTYLSVLVANDYLSYSKKLLVNRVVGSTARNAVESGETAVLIKNDAQYETASLTGIDFIGKYPGTLGNGLVIDVADSVKFQTWELASQFDYIPDAGEFAVAVVDGAGAWTGAGAIKQVERVTVLGAALADGDVTVAGLTVAVLEGDTAAEVAAKIKTALDGLADIENVVINSTVITFNRVLAGQKTGYTGYVDNGLSVLAEIITTGSLGTILERYELMSNVAGAKKATGEIAYFVDAINKRSDYIRIGDDSIVLTSKTITLAGGVDDNKDVNLTAAFEAFNSSEEYDINFIIAGAVTPAEQKAATEVSVTRRDCITFVSPQFDDCVNNSGDETADIISWRTLEYNKNTSYAFMDNNWALVYDRYNDVNRWIPCCGGTAGLLARTYVENEPWFSPAGYTRGQYKNYIRLAWSPKKAQRDQLYKNQVNPIVSFSGRGIVLFGDKTAQTKTSSFDRINVRCMFIVIEKTIADFSRYFLFEINDEFTRKQFLNVVRPYLRNVQAGRGLEDFRVIADETNNTGQVIASNTMVGAIYVKPAYSINFIRLDFTAVRPDISFDEIETGLTTI